MSGAPLVPAAALVAAGIALGLQRPVPIGGGPLAFATALAGLTVSLLAMAGVRFRPVVLLPILLLCGLGLGSVARAQAGQRCAAVVPADVPLAVDGVLESAVGGRLRIRLTEVLVAGVRRRCAETVPARWSGGPPPPGHAVRGVGRWWRPSAAGGLSPGGVLMLDSLASVRPRGSGLAAARGDAARRLEGLYGRRAGLANSLLLAQRDGLARDVRERFARAGLSHLLAISGLHVGLVAGLLLLAGRLLRLRRRGGALLAGGGTVAYVLFLGAPAAASRAGLQVLFVLLAAALQRPARSEALVAAAALILLALDPVSLAAPGFQLSFAGVLGLLALRRPLLRRLSRLETWRPGGVGVGRWLADGLATGLAATLATAPFVAWHFGRVAPIGVAASLPAIPLVAALVPTLALSLVAHTAWAPAGEFLAGAGSALLAGLDAVADVAAAVPGGSLAVTPAWALLGSAAALGGYAATRRLGRVRPWVRGLAAAGAAAVILIFAAVRVPSDRLEIHMIDVGQGDAIALRSPAGRWILVDAGVAGAGHDAGERRVVPYLGRRGVRRLESLILTHPHADHFGGAEAVLRALRPRWVGDPGVRSASPGYLDLLQAAAAAGIPWVRLRDGVELELDGATLEFLHPWPGDRPGGRADGPAGELDPNDVSVVFRVAYGGFSALFTGDASAPIEEALVARWGPALEAEVLKTGHHGSRTSTSGSILAATGATIALVSAGRGNRYGHPHPVVLRRLDSAGVRVLRTDRDGTVVVRGDRAGRIDVEREREDG